VTGPAGVGTRSKTSRLKAVELASGLGAIALGAGLALSAPDVLRAYALPLLAGGLIAHAGGMTLKYRIEARQGSPIWWERALFWLCWLCLAGLAIWIAAVLVRR
jgi:hypothetical protein